MTALYLTGWRKPEPGFPASVRHMVARDEAQTISVTFAVEYRVWQDLRQALMDEAQRNERMTIQVNPEEWQITETRPLDMGDQRYGEGIAPNA